MAAVAARIRLPSAPRAEGSLSSQRREQVMLILSRKLNESIVIDNEVVIRVMSLSGRRVRIGIEAPADRPVLRKEVWDRMQPENAAAERCVSKIIERARGIGEKQAS